ncbi:hypothetical protein Cgig2_029148 [Carnegiea gigantea]|uniref:Uncharacterized protein n=1 Tax=Carnegiea gigantea TaxID=171969 RepID=A0A9Q1KLE2_9CARY|nr:hypothetical protein Cgig2_029148 [Carnegiea gigantea]
MSTASCGRSRSGDRFYNPPQVRRQLQLQQQQQQQLLLQKQEREGIRRQKNNHHQQQQQQQRRHHKPAAQPRVKAAESSENRPESDDCASTATTAPPASVSNSTNLDRFLEYTTPLVPAQHFSKTSMKGWRTQGDEFRSYFVLGDLWESFKEWSAYGAGVPLLLNGSDSVVQYYVPYLSGIQLYIDPSKPSLRMRRPGEESDESSRETSSDGSSDCEIERVSSLGMWSQQELAVSTLQEMKGLSLQSKPSNGSSSSEGESSSFPGVLVFEYLEHDAPYSREPLADKASFSALNFLPLPFCAQNEWQCHYGSCAREVPNGFDMALELSLPIFGMACYKFKISVWDQNGVDECQRANSLLQAADEWLRLLNVNHPDYKFFVSHSYHWR